MMQGGEPFGLDRIENEPPLERVTRKRSERDLAQTDFVTRNVRAKRGRGDIEAEQHSEEIRHRVGQMHVAHRAKVAHCNRAVAIEAAVELRLALKETGKRLAIRRIEVGYLARSVRLETEFRDHQFGALAQIDREADAEPEQELQMSVAQVFNGGLEVATSQMLKAEVHVVVSHLDRDTQRLGVAKVDRTRDQHLVAHRGHLAA